MPTGWAVIILDAIQALVFHWPTWLALIIAQVVTLFVVHGFDRWLPMGLLAVGLLWAFIRPLMRGGA
jgi:hypothetical protein